MPKILWKNILDSSRRELVLAIVMIPLFWLGITEGSFGGLNQVMYIYNLMISIFSIFSNHNRSAFELPQYMYLAPYSREQRQHYIQKMFKYRFRVSYIVLLLPILITAIIRPDKTLTVSVIVYYMCEMLVMAGILYCTSFDNYLGSVKELSCLLRFLLQGRIYNPLANETICFPDETCPPRTFPYPIHEPLA